MSVVTGTLSPMTRRTAADRHSDSRPAALSAPQTIGIDVREDLTLAAATSADAVLRDFNNDGIQDLAVATFEGTVEVRLGRPHGAFAGPIVVELPGRLAALAAGDLDNDRDLDLIVLRQDKQLVTSLVNDGSGTFHIAANAATPPDPVDVLQEDLHLAADEQRLEGGIVDVHVINCQLIHGIGMAVDLGEKRIHIVELALDGERKGRH